MVRRKAIAVGCPARASFNNRLCSANTVAGLSVVDESGVTVAPSDIVERGSSFP